MAIRFIVLVAAITQAVVVPIFFPGGFKSVPARPDAPTGPIPLEPAGYAFVIWLLIYLGSIAYAIYQLRPRAPGADALGRIAPLTATAFAASTAWTVFAARGPLWPTAALIIVMAACLVSALIIAMRRAPERHKGFGGFVIAPIGLYGGWVTVASFVNATDVLRGYGIVAALADIGSVLYPVIALVAVLAALALVVLARGVTAYAGAIAWALAGVVVANLTRDLSHVVAAIAATGAIAVLATSTLGLRRRSPA